MRIFFGDAAEITLNESPIQSQDRSDPQEGKEGKELIDPFGHLMRLDVVDDWIPTALIVGYRPTAMIARLNDPWRQ